MTSFPFRPDLSQLRTIPLTLVLQQTGAVIDRHDKAKWQSPQGIISVTGMKFYNWTQGAGGGGAIDLMMHLQRVDFKQAVELLCHVCPVPLQTVSRPHRSPPSQLHLPPPVDRNLPRVKRYLIRQRGLALDVIEGLIHCHHLYADARANAVFVLLGKENTPVGAELRGTGDRLWRSMAAGSKKDQGYFSIRPQHVSAIILCESAIDALSCASIHPHTYCISTAGARSNPRWLAALLRTGCPLYCGFDADPTGDSMALTMMDLYPQIKRIRPSRKDWNDVLVSSR
jgi:hypothetical protein